MAGQRAANLATLVLCFYCIITQSEATAVKDDMKRSDDNTIEELQTLVQQQSAVNEQQSTLIQQQSAVFQTLQARLTAVENRIAATDSSVLKLEKKVVFSADFAEGGSINIGESSPIPFSHVITNLGNGYDPRSGVFIAPTSGTYLFLLHARGDGSTAHWARLAIVKSGTDLTYLDIHGDQYVWDETSAFVTTHVNAGEKVFVKHHDGSSSLHKWRGTAFTGILLYAD